MTAALESLFRYQAWANAAFFDKLEALDADTHGDERRRAIRLLSHSHAVAEIFAAHLAGREHGYDGVDGDETPDVAALRAAVTVSDRWYLDFVRGTTQAALSEEVAFRFTDGDKGFMSREEMLWHVVLHSGYHRGEIGRILMQVPSEAPWDTFAVFLHQDQPERRHQDEPDRAPASSGRAAALSH